MKKTIFIAGILISTIIIFAAEKKANFSPAISGLWKGKISPPSSKSYDDPNDPSTYWVLLRNNGTCRFYTGTKNDTASAEFKNESTYSFSNNIFKATYKNKMGMPFSLSATVNNAADYMKGTWGFGPNATNGGVFYFSKQ